MIISLNFLNSETPCQDARTKNDPAESSALELEHQKAYTTEDTVSQEKFAQLGSYWFYFKSIIVNLKYLLCSCM